MRRLTTLLALAILSSLTTSFVFAQSALPNSGSAILVLDASGSMWGKIGNEHKIEIAREAIADMVADWDPSVDLGLMAYGHRRKSDCLDIETLIAPGKVNKDKFIAVANDLNPKGMTPMTSSVIQAAKALDHTQQKATVILISDGKETCDIDPCEMGALLESQGVDFTAHIIGFDVPKEDSAGLACLAKETGGVFIEAANTEELKSALKQAMKVSLVGPHLNLGQATVSVPAEVQEGGVFQAQWTGPKNPSDYLAIRSPDREARFHSAIVGAENIGSEVELIAPDKAGNYVVYYEVSADHEPLGSANLTVIPATGYLVLASKARAGSDMSVDWSGPGNSGDGIFVYRAGEDRSLYRVTARASDAKPAIIKAPEAAGEYELKLKTNGRVLATAKFLVIPVVSQIKVLTPLVLSGESVVVQWEGPRNKGDRLAVAVAGDPNYHSQRPAAGSTKSLVKLRVSKEPGKYEVRLQTSSGKILASQPFEVR